MRFRGRTLDWDSPMPATPMRQRHESPKRGDNIGAIKRAKGQAFDANVQGPWWMHWPDPARNGYTRIYDDTRHRTRRMTRAERRRPWWDWSEENILDWRRRNGERPLKDEEALRHCAAVGALPIREIKFPGAGTDPSWFERYVEHSKRQGVPAFFKTLPSMRGAQGKVVLCRAAGGQIAFIYGNTVRGRSRRVARTARLTQGWAVRPNGTW